MQPPHERRRGGRHRADGPSTVTLARELVEVDAGRGDDRVPVDVGLHAWRLERAHVDQQGADATELQTVAQVRVLLALGVQSAHQDDRPVAHLATHRLASLTIARTLTR